MTTFLGEFKEKQNLIETFCIKDDDLQGVEILYADYYLGDYEGSAFVLFKKDNELFEVNAYHCSCFGLENQWEPEPTTKEALTYRMENGFQAYDNPTVLKILEAE